MKERPIIFSGESVRAILDGRKTMTRRVVTHLKGKRRFLGGDSILDVQAVLAEYPLMRNPHVCPYGQPGDRLWVRETWNTLGGYHHADSWQERKPIYRASWTYDERKWKSPIYMPREYSRITLEVTTVRVERLREISYAGILAEGIGTAQYWEREGGGTTGAITAFATAWNALNDKRGYPWESNPFVWVVEFKRIDA